MTPGGFLGASGRRYVNDRAVSRFTRCLSWCEDCLVHTRIRPEQPVSERSSATRSNFSSCFHCLSLVSQRSQPSSASSIAVHRLPLNHRRKIPADESHSFPPPHLHAFPFPFIYLPFFLHTLGNDDQHLAAAVRPQFSFSVFSFILFTFFIQFSNHPAQRPVYIPTP